MGDRQRYVQMPMPPGWEVKYDFSSRKYFFIDHNTKNTSWEDPRPAYYAKIERQRQHQQQPSQQLQPSPAAPSRYSQAVSSLNDSARSRSPAQSPARRPETIQLQQVRFQQEHQHQSATDESEDDFPPTVAADDYEITVLMSKFPSQSKADCQKALAAARRERPNRKEGHLGRAIEFLRAQTEKAKQGPSAQDRELAGKCRSLHSDFPQLTEAAIMDVLRECEGNMYRSKERLKVMAERQAASSSSEGAGDEAKVRALAKKFPAVQRSLIADLVREAAGRSDAEEYVHRSLEFLQAEAAGGSGSGARPKPPSAQIAAAAAAASTSGAARHPSPQPRSLVEGQDSLERQRAHRQLVVDLSREFPMLERALVRSTLSSVSWNIARAREKLQALRASVSSSLSFERSASPAGTGTPPVASPAQSQASRGPSPHPGTSAVRSHSPQAAQSVVRPSPVRAAAPKPKKKSKPAPQRAPVPPAPLPNYPAVTISFQHPTVARGPDRSLVQGHNPTLANGPDPSLRNGPAGVLARGPAGSVGADVNNRRGTDPSLLRRAVAHL